MISKFQMLRPTVFLSKRLVFLACLVLVFTASVFADEKPASTDAGDSVVGLSPYEVTAQKLVFKNWIKVSSPHYLVYTDASKKEALLLAKQMEMIYQAVQFFLHRRAMKSAPTIIVLPTSNSDWRKIGSKGNVDWKVATTLIGTTRSVILVEDEWQGESIGSVWGLLALREVRAMNLDGPLWYTTGMGYFFRTVEFDQNTLTIGKEGYDSAWIQKLGWMDWDKFFQVRRDSPEYRKDSEAHTRYMAQCGQFVHFALTNADHTLTPRLLTWSARLEAGDAPTDDHFKEVFGMDWKSLQHQMDLNLKGGSYTTGRIEFPPQTLAFPVTVSEPATAELRELFVLGQIMNQKTADSDASLNTLLTRGLKTNLWRELLADACDAKHRADAELDQLQTIIKEGSTNTRVYSRAAELLFEKFAPERNLEAHTGPQADEIRALCLRALEIEPLNPDANNMLTWLEAYSATIEKPNLELITQICRRLDGNATTDEALCALVVARYRSGNVASTRSLAEKLLASPLCRKPARKTAQAVLDRLNAAPQPAATPTS